MRIGWNLGGYYTYEDTGWYEQYRSSFLLSDGDETGREGRRTSRIFKPNTGISTAQGAWSWITVLNSIILVLYQGLCVCGCECLFGLCLFLCCVLWRQLESDVADSFTVYMEYIHSNLGYRKCLIFEIISVRVHLLAASVQKSRFKFKISKKGLFSCCMTPNNKRQMCGSGLYSYTRV
jgi:hypothetical protein